MKTSSRLIACTMGARQSSNGLKTMPVNSFG